MHVVLKFAEEGAPVPVEGYGGTLYGWSRYCPIRRMQILEMSVAVYNAAAEDLIVVPHHERAFRRIPVPEFVDDSMQPVRSKLVPVPAPANILFVPRAPDRQEQLEVPKPVWLGRRMRAYIEALPPETRCRAETLRDALQYAGGPLESISVNDIHAAAAYPMNGFEIHLGGYIGLNANSYGKTKDPPASPSLEEKTALPGQCGGGDVSRSQEFGGEESTTRAAGPPPLPDFGQRDTGASGVGAAQTLADGGQESRSAGALA